ncbi:MAG: N-acetylmuramoyl-L-alanine amidase [Oscillospiraceae bacterium]|nr:N-acetylmuramoyl-L-alanine amidase [Oscillospiraceae bacterium]
MKRILGILMLAIFLLYFVQSVSVTEIVAVTDSSTESRRSNLPVRESRFRLPQNMRGVVLRPELIQLEEGEYTAQIPDEVFDEIASLGMNTAIIETFYYNENHERSRFYSADMNRGGEPSPLSEVLDSARNRNLNVFLVFDINTALFNTPNSEMRTLNSTLNSLITEIHKFTVRYRSDGVILDNYYNTRCSESFRRYMKLGSGIGYENWLFDSTEMFFRSAADTVRLTDNTVPVGIMLRDVWANFSVSNSRGSGTSASFQAYYDGFADTLSFVENAHVDFAFLHTPDALISNTSESAESNINIPFNAITTHWNRASRHAEIPLYVVHHNQRMGENAPGWSGDDQLLRQISSARELDAFGGSVFNSLDSLRNNPLNSTETLRAFFDDEINEETLFLDLVMNSPRQLNFVTNDAVAIFQGTHDDNFSVYINNNEIALNEAGNFYVEMPLSVGANHFTLSHKGQTVNYSIERRIVALYSVDESIATGQTLQIDGETNITINAIAYRGATVTATIGDKTIALTEQEVPLYDAELNISYAMFEGNYRVPEGIIGREQELGTIRVTASYQGFTNTIIGANVVIIALPEPAPPPPPMNVTWFDRVNAGTGEIVGRIEPARTPDQSIRLVRMLHDNTCVFPAGTTGFRRDPNLSPLPAGTLDYFRATVGEFYITESGRRIMREQSELINSTGFGENALTVLSSGSDSNTGHSFLRLTLEHRTALNIRLGGLDFRTEWGGAFNVREFNATHVYVDFDNVTTVTGLPSFEDNPLFSAGMWETIQSGDITKFRLILQLRQRGVYGGHFASYNADGELILNFRSTPNSLSGMNIVIDPGHGITATGFDPGAIAHIREFDANIAVANELRTVLVSRGANAIILPTDQTFLATRNRPNYARTLHNACMLISLHSNAVTGNSSVKGQEVWYFTPFSQPLANTISESMANYFGTHVYTDRTRRNRGAKYAPFLVTLAQDFPSVLVEMGFVTNIEDAMALANPIHQAGIANAIADGIVSYLEGV